MMFERMLHLSFRVLSFFIITQSQKLQHIEAMLMKNIDLVINKILEFD